MIEENMLRGSLVSSNEAKGGLGFKGERGYSAYEIAVQHGYEGTEEDWLATLGTSSHFSKDVAVYETTAASTTEFNTPITVATGDFVDVYVNGFKLNENEYTFDISKVTLTNPVLNGNTVEVIVNRMSTNNLPISSTIGYSSTNDTAAGSKAVYDYVKITNDNVGELRELTTTEKTSIVEAINENQGNIEALDEKTTPMYCKATITTTPTAATNYYVPLNDFRINTGNFTFQDGGIKIPSGINHVRISGSVFLNNFPGGTNYLWTKIYRVRGTTTDHISGSLNNSTASFISASVPEVITNVQEGDIIKLMADSPNGGTIRAYGPNTWLMVEKID